MLYLADQTLGTVVAGALFGRPEGRRGGGWCSIWQAKSLAWWVVGALFCRPEGWRGGGGC